MDDRNANIDILFRNGLKDYEALPPQQVWDNISPVIRKKQKPVLMFRAAATVAVIVSLGLLYQRWNQEVTSDMTANILNDDISSLRKLAANEVNEPITISIPAPEAMPVNVTRSDNNITEDFPERIIIDVNRTLSEPTNQYNLMIDRRVRDQVQSITEVKTSLNSLYLYPGDELVASNVKTITKRWSLSALVSPAYYSNMSSVVNASAPVNLTADQAQISYTGGLALSYKVNKRVTIQSGVFYSSIGQEIPGIQAYSGFSAYNTTKGVRNFFIQTINGTIYTNNGDVFLSDNLDQNRVITRYTNDVFDPQKAELQYVNSSVLQNFRYLELPFFVRYKILDKTLDVNVIGGFSSNLLVNNSVYTPKAEGKYQIGATDDLNPVVFSSSFGMGMEYSFSDRLSLNLEPTFRYYLNPFSQLTGMSIHPYSFGVFSGLTYKF